MNDYYKENGNPWRGLEAYKDGEVLYGRDEDIRSLSQRVITDVDTVLYGRSGIGKSSLINAGIIPSARRKGFCPMSIKLVHTGNVEHGEDFIPYIKQIRSAIESAGITIKAVSEPVGDEELVWELFHRNMFYNDKGERTKLLVIFDQFEEIFTLQQHADHKRQFFAQMADMLNDIKPASLTKEEEIKTDSTTEVTQVVLTDNDDINLDDLNLDADIAPEEFVYDNEIHFIFTLREDFLSDFEYFTSAIPSLKQHRYGLRPINEEQAAEIIMRPRYGLVSKEVAKQIIVKVTRRSDFELDGIPEIEVDSAVLSLYLTHLYEGKDGDKITEQQIEAQGGKIITDFYSECIKGIDERKVEYLENTLINEEGRRENKSESIISREVGDDVIRKLLDKKLLRHFLYANEMRIEFIHDTLCDVVKGRKEKREQLKQRKRERRRIKIAAMSAAAIMFIAACVFGYYYWERKWMHVSYYAQIEYVNGWPKGVGEELSEEQRKRTPLYYKLTHQGNIDHNTRIEVMSSNPKLPKSPRLVRYEVCHNDSDRLGQAYNELLSSVKSVRFVQGENGKVDKEIMEGEDRKILFVINYFYLDNKNAWVQFLHANGTSMQIRDNEIDRLKISWDSIADNTLVVSSLRYYDKEGVCRPIEGKDDEGICGFLWERPKANTTICYRLDNLGIPVQSKSRSYNTVVTYSNGDTTDVRYYNEVAIPEKEGKNPTNEAENEDGFARCLTIGNIDSLYRKGENVSHAWIKVEKDDKGNVKKREANGNIPKTMPYLVKYEYDKTTGYMKKKEKRNKKGNPFGQLPNDIYLKTWNYDKKGRLTSEKHVTQNGQTAYEYIATYTDAVETQTTIRLFPARSYIKRVDSISGGRRSTSFFGENDRMINKRIPVGKAEENDSIECHRVVVYEKKGENKTDTITSYYYFYDIDAHTEKPDTTSIKYSWKAVSYYQRIETKDANGNTLTLQLKDVDGKIIKSMRYIIQGGETIGRGAMGVNGGFVRCPYWEEEGFGYYKLYFTKDFERNYVWLHAYNEYEQPSVFDYGAENSNTRRYRRVTYKTYSPADSTIYIVSKHRSQEMRKKFKQFEMEDANDLSNTEIPYLHILSQSSALHDSGLQDNDRLIRVGAWKFGMSKVALDSQWNKMETTGGEFSIEVLRCEDNTLRRKRFNVLIAGNSLFAEYHIMPLTEQEEKMWRQCYTHI